MDSTTPRTPGAAGEIPAVMESAVYRRPGDIGVEERPVPRPGPGEVLVEVAYCGMCGSDLHIMIEGWGKPGFVGGHEYTGIVVSGRKRRDELVAGRRRGVRTVAALRECRRCLERKPSQCGRRAAP